MKQNHLIQRLPSTFLKRGERATVINVKGDKLLKQKLFDQGIIPGCQIFFINGGMNLPCVIKVNGSQIMMSWDVLSTLIVSL